MKHSAIRLPDPGRCPLCGDPNHCALAAGGNDCWCRVRTFPREIFARIPAPALHRACVCRACLDAAGKADPGG